MKMKKKEKDEQKYADRCWAESASPEKRVKHVASLRSGEIKSLICRDEINHTTKHTPIHKHTNTYTIRPRNLNAAQSLGKPINTKKQ